MFKLIAEVKVDGINSIAILCPHFDPKRVNVNFACILGGTPDNNPTRVPLACPESRLSCKDVQQVNNATVILKR